MNDSSSKPRQRFDRKVRRSMILDSAAELVIEEGTSQLSLETIGKKAGVSKTLMYRYFESLTELLRELLDRELTSLRQLQTEAAESADTYEELVRKVTKAYLRYIEERGLVIQKLQAYPDISGAQDPTYFRREAAVEYMAHLTADTFNMPLDIATASAEISFGLPAAAGEYLIRSGTDRQLVEDMTVAMILGGLTGIQFDVLGGRKKLTRPLPTTRKSKQQP